MDNNWLIVFVFGMNLMFEFLFLVKFFVDKVDDVVFVGEFMNEGYGLYKL